MEGPTSPRAFATRFSSGRERGSLANASVMMNMSSMPTPMMMKMHIMDICVKGMPA
jgi:hypothetical protein